MTKDKYVVRYTELVTYEVYVQANNVSEAIELVKNGEYVDVFEIDSMLEDIKSVKLED
jgi:hypothetical protein